MSADNPHKDNSGVLFPSSPKWLEQAPEGRERPALTGEATVMCEHCQKANRLRVAGWNKTGKQSGKPYVSLLFQKPTPKQTKKGGAS